MNKVTLRIDDKTVEIADTSMVIEAAKAAGIEIPHYCYHPALGNPGVCRLCMVEVEGMPKLQVSCRLRVKEGMVVRTSSGLARRAQASSLEFHLVNHPLDCPVCDQAGECGLQDYYMRYGLYAGSVREDKVHKHKRLDIGRHIMLDTERCILCTRCVRFLDQVTGTSELGVFNRGDRSELLPYPGMKVDNPYSGNIADICPVGALTDKDFRFKVRVWYLKKTPGVCIGCSRGCAIEVHTNTERLWHNSGRRVARLKPRDNPQVNGPWMCDEGRYGFSCIDDATRLRQVSLLDNGKLRALDWEGAVPSLAAELRRHCAEKGSDGLAVILSARLSNEDLFAARMLFVDVLKAGRILIEPGPDQLGEEDRLLRRCEKVPNLRGAKAFGFGERIPESSWSDIEAGILSGKIWGLYVVDRDPTAVWSEPTRKALSSLPWTAYQGVNANRFMELCRWVLPSCAFVEEDSTFTNFEGMVQRSHAALPGLGKSRPDWSVWGEVLRALGKDFPYDSAQAIFNGISKCEADFAGLDWDGLGAFGQKLKSEQG